MPRKRNRNKPGELSKLAAAEQRIAELEDKLAAMNRALVPLQASAVVDVLDMPESQARRLRAAARQELQQRMATELGTRMRVTEAPSDLDRNPFGETTRLLTASVMLFDNDRYESLRRQRGLSQWRPVAVDEVEDPNPMRFAYRPDPQFLRDNELPQTATVTREQFERAAATLRRGLAL